MSAALPDYALDDAALLARCRVERLAASGPGGQHANRNACGIRLTHDDSGIAAASGDAREQRVNRSQALARLRLRLALQQRGQADAAWLAERRRGRQLPVGAHAKGYHLVVAVLLDELERQQGSLAACAQALGLGSTQVAKALCADKEVRLAGDALRARFGLGAMKG
jgi:hypothetical protein